MDAFIEVLVNILTFFTNACIYVGGFFATLFIEKNYIALAAVLVACVLIGTAIGKISKKLKSTR